MALVLYYHPLSSYCHKALIALYENDIAFEKLLVNLGDETSRNAFLKIWPVGKFPVLKDTDRDWVVPESSIIIEYLDQRFPGKTRFIPADPDRARQTRMRDRFFDLYVHSPMQKIVGDRIRPAGSRDEFGVNEAKRQLRTALDLIDQDMAKKTWAMGDEFTLADCAAAPALWYGNKVLPFAETHKNAMAYLKRLEARPSYARTLKEAEPYLAMFPQG